MALTSAQIITLALQIAKVPRYTSQAGQILNSILSDLCQRWDLDLAKKTFNFNFTPATVPIGNLNVQLASGPFILPVDYLRAKIGDVLYFPTGLGNFPLKLTPIDLEEFDGLVQQVGWQNFPVYWATDMSQAAPVLTTSGNTHATTTLDGLASISAIAAGNGVAGPGIVPGTTVISVGASSVILSRAATSSVTAGSFFFGVAPIAYAWPPVSGAYPAMVRYYSQMPDIVTPETSTTIPWFPNQEYLRKRIAAGVMEITGDDRRAAFLTDAENELRGYLQMKDDHGNRSSRVTMDRRRFGTQWSTLPKSKTFGY